MRSGALRFCSGSTGYVLREPVTPLKGVTARSADPGAAR